MPPKKAAPAPATASSEAPTTNGVIKAKATKKSTSKAAADPAAKSTAEAASKLPAKRATKAAPKASPKSNATKTVAKPATTKTTAKAAPKSASAVSDAETKVAANTSKKRKATEEDDEQQPKINGVKRQRSSSISPAPAPAATKAKAATKPKAPTAKKLKTKIVINYAPVERQDVYVFGTGDAGELGLGSEKGQQSVKRPRLNPLLAADKIGVVSQSVGGMHTAVLTHDNKILTWGVNDTGALGRDTEWDGGYRDMDDDSDSDDSETNINPRESMPTEVDMSALPEGIVWTQITCTDSATFALTNDGFVYGWGTFRVSFFSLQVHLCSTNISPRTTKVHLVSVQTPKSNGGPHSSRVSKTLFNSSVAPTMCLPFLRKASSQPGALVSKINLVDAFWNATNTIV
jgi:Regulator of chromosome condensation (RCC1) repeat